MSLLEPPQDDGPLWGELRALVHAIPETTPRQLSMIYLQFSAQERATRVRPYLRGVLAARWASWRDEAPREARWQFATLAQWIWGQTTPEL